MSYVSVNGAKLFFEDQGAGSETIVFAHGLMFSHRMFAAQVEALKRKYRCIAFDFRAHGKSQVTEGGYSMDEQAEDTAKFIRGLHCGPCHFVGLSMGSYVGIRLAVKYPNLVKSMTLLGTSADRQPKFTAYIFHCLNRSAKCGPRLRKGVVNIVIGLMFTRKFRTSPKRSNDKERWRREMFANYNFKAVKAVIDRASVYDELNRISVPTLVIVGGKDGINPPKLGKRIQAAVDGAKLTRIPEAGHIATLEEPDAVTIAIEEFIREI